MRPGSAGQHLALVALDVELEVGALAGAQQLGHQAVEPPGRHDLGLLLLPAGHVREALVAGQDGAAARVPVTLRVSSPSLSEAATR